MSDTADPVATRIHAALQDTLAVEDELPESSMLRGWVVVAEWLDPDGNRWLSKKAGGANAESIPDWQLNGYLHEALDGGFNEADE